MTRRDTIALLMLSCLMAGLASTAVAKQIFAGNRTKSINNLKQLGISAHNFNDSFNTLPHNGGEDTLAGLKTVNYGWANSKIAKSGSWVMMIMPFIEQDPFFRAIDLTGTDTMIVPELPDAKRWQVTVKTLMDPERNRAGFRKETEKGRWPGPLTDYALNVFLNSQPFLYSEVGYAIKNDQRESGDWAAANTKMTIQAIADGSSNTLMMGMKALPGKVKEEKPKNAEEPDDVCAPVPAQANENSNPDAGDEAIFSPGNWSIKDGKKVLNSSGTGRGHPVVKKPVSEAPKEYSLEAGVPWFFTDTELAGTKTSLWQTAWGSPYSTGVPFALCDGSVRMVGFKQKGTANLARLLYPNDGNIVMLD